jgi:hypothetical protein
MSPSYKELAAVVPAHRTAIVTASNMTERELVLPRTDDDEELPEAALFLTACALRYHDAPVFVQAQLKWRKRLKAKQG